MNKDQIFETFGTNSLFLPRVRKHITFLSLLLNYFDIHSYRNSEKLYQMYLERVMICKYKAAISYHISIFHRKFLRIFSEEEAWSLSYVTFETHQIH